MDTEFILKYGVRILIIFMILPIHEFAHAWVAHKLGDNTALGMGRLTINPISHIDPFGALCLLLTGFGWAKPVPVNPYNFRKNRRGSMALTAAAGPLSNLIVAYIGMVVYRTVIGFVTLSETYSAVTYYIYLIFMYFVVINIGLAIFNLIPCPPLDGSRILGYFLPESVEEKLERYEMIIYIVFIVIIFSGLLDGPIEWIQTRVWNLFIFLTNWVEAIFSLFI